MPSETNVASVEEIFLAAVEKSPADRAVYLDAACGADAALRAEVVALLRSHQEAGSLLEQPLFQTGPTVDQPSGEIPGTVIGPYKLVEQVGEGGMGTVWMAQQTEPVKRLVAVKLIKAGMDSKAVIARFEAERQALALMDHPNIARVLDGGTTDAGRPYFVMDLVKGVPITRYCDENRLTPRQRLELFVPVCQAIQHAHQKGIIHRDLKPSNVLVALYDGRPIPKVIDFGVAKAAGQILTEKTLVTGFGNIVGTLEYMSPEQAEVNQLDIDTRSDIYSLGVLLYELLTGTPPFSRTELKTAGMIEMLRVIREQEPSKPSTKLSTAEGLPTLAANRGTEPAKLAKLVRGELDWIVMKALEKDRNRRYETANGFAMDVQRYLADEPVQACPPSVGYRLRKFARRNKGGLAVVALVLFFMMLLGSVAGWAWRDRAARLREAELERMARAAELANNLEQSVERAEFLQREGKRGQALAALERARLLAREAQPAPPWAERLEQLQQLLDAEGRDEAFVAQFETIRREAQTEVNVEKNEFRVENAYLRLRAALEQYGIAIGVTPPGDAVSRIQQRSSGVQTVVVSALNECLRFASREDPDSRQWLLDVLREADSDAWRNQVRGSWTQPEKLEGLVQGLDVRRQPPSFLVPVVRALPIESSSRLSLARSTQFAYPGDFWANHRLGMELKSAGKHAESIRYFTAALGLLPDNPGVLLNRGVALRRTGELDAAIADLRRAVTIAPQYAAAHRELGNALSERKLDGAVAAYREAIRLQPDIPSVHHNLGRFLRNVKHDNEGAIGCFRRVIKLEPRNVQAHYDLAHTLSLQGKLDDAIDVYRKGIEIDASMICLYTELGHAFRRQNKLDDAIDAYRKALKLAPTSTYCHADLGSALGLRGNLDEAIAIYHAGIRAQPDKAHGYHAFACFLRDIKHDIDGAVANFRKALELEPKDAFIHFDFGGTMLKFGKLDEAAAAFRESLRLNPSNGAARYALAWVLDELAWPLATSPVTERRDPVRAVRLAKEAVELKPEAGAFWKTLGAAHFRAGDCKEAIAALETSMEKRNGGDGRAEWFFLAMAYWKVGEKDKARTWYERGVQSMNKFWWRTTELSRFRSEASELLELKEKK